MQKLEELKEKKRRLLEEQNARKESLYQLVHDSKDTQNKALKMTRIIRADRDAYLKLGNLQQTTTKGQVALKGYKPEGQNSTIQSTS